MWVSWGQPAPAYRAVVRPARRVKLPLHLPVDIQLPASRLTNRDVSVVPAVRGVRATRAQPINRLRQGEVRVGIKVAEASLDVAAQVEFESNV
jgi:hypothetical protein